MAAAEAVSRPAREPQVSVVIPTHNRPAALKRLLSSLRSQDTDAFEVVVVDDGSEPPIVLDPGTEIRVLRRSHGERSTARNLGATHSRGTLLLFIDDDLELAPTLVSAHVTAQRDWRGCMAIGAIQLPPEWLATPFGAFRQSLESEGMPRERGPVSVPNFGTAANMSIARQHFLELGGFDPLLASAEDQDLALRHSNAGERIVYLPEAVAVHHDENSTLAEYCRRVEWGAAATTAFVMKHPALAANQLRARLNGPGAQGDAVRLRLTKLAKALLGGSAAIPALICLSRWLERWSPGSPLLIRLYRLLIGIHIQRGFRRGWTSRAASAAA